MLVTHRNPLGCLGQGGSDPVSETLKSLYGKGLDSPTVEWAIWNDELQVPRVSGFSHH